MVNFKERNLRAGLWDSEARMRWALHYTCSAEKTLFTIQLSACCWSLLPKELIVILHAELLTVSWILFNYTTSIHIATIQHATCTMSEKAGEWMGPGPQHLPKNVTLTPITSTTDVQVLSFVTCHWPCKGYLVEEAGAWFINELVLHVDRCPKKQLPFPLTSSFKIIVVVIFLQILLIYFSLEWRKTEKQTHKQTWLWTINKFWMCFS